jgi:TetR/AcrR family transcriptional regulator, cholesterol catabolism regulator
MSSKNYRNSRSKTARAYISTPAEDGSLVEKRQSEIVDVACRLFFERGYHGVSVRDIASESGMSMGMLYHYISSKGDILFLIARHLQKLWSNHLEEAGIQKRKDPLDRLIRSLRTSIEFYAEHKELLQFMYSESKYFGKEHLKVILADEEKNVVGFYRKLLEEVADQYSVKINLDLAGRFISYITIFTAQKGYSLKKYSSKQTTDFMVDFILTGLGLTKKDLKL